MGSFKQLIRIAHPQRPDVPRELEILVDTGATFTKLPQDLLSQLGIEATSSKRTLLADGRILTRPSGHARITIQDSTDTVPVTFGSRGEPMFLGATTLEILGFMVDPIAPKLVPREFLEPSESS